MEGCALLYGYGFEGDDTPIIRGAALKALVDDPELIVMVEMEVRELLS
ncbi:MAG: hypothetical protein IKF51_04470 [Solobacterium sp.]|nr:hypothetical protein [Solobacterium sp.]